MGGSGTELIIWYTPAGTTAKTPTDLNSAVCCMTATLTECLQSEVLLVVFLTSPQISVCFDIVLKLSNIP